MRLHLILLLLIIGSFIKAQTGRLSGTVLDAKTGETLPGATVLIEGTTKGSSVDFDGKFVLNNVPIGKVNVVISYISYSTKKITDILINANEPVDINVLLEASTNNDLQEIEVVVTLNKENNTALVLQQKNNASVSDGISAETIKKTPDRNSSDVLKRVSGVTIQDDKFVIIRGLNERYNASYLNNSPLPSTEPDRKAFAFDLFPANMLDNIIVIKTATPDMPSEFAGGIVQVNTKSIPEKNFVSFSAGAGYNTITTGKSKTIYEGGKYDIIGFDDGSRDLSKDVPDLKDKNLWAPTPEQAKVAKFFKNDWAYSQSKFAPNTSAQFALGYNFKRKEKDFIGLIFSLGYYNVQNLYNIKRTEYEELSVSGENKVKKPIDQEYINQVNQTQTSTGSLLNIAIKLNENNSISLKNLVSGSADNKFITSNGTNNYNEQNVILDRINTRFFSANQIISSQLNSDHFIPKQKIKIQFNTGLSSVKRTVPNLRFTAYGKFTNLKEFDPSEGPNLKDTVYRAYVSNSSSTGPDYAGFRVYSRLDENLASSKLDASRLFKINENLKIDIKVGAFYQFRTRQYNLRRFGLSQYNSFQGQPVFFDDSLMYVKEAEIFSTENMGVLSNGKGGFKAIEDTKTDDNYAATSKLFAAYSMGEIKLSEKLRIITGLRYENYTQKLTVNYVTFDSIYVQNTIADVLPSVNTIYNINDKLAIRLAYYKTLNRPEFRELAGANWYDPETRLSNAGNPNLVRSEIKNYDVRFEIYPGRGQLFTTSGFYKYFDKPIERYMLAGNAIQVYYKNANFAKVFGAEMEYRINVGSILKKDSIKFLNNLNLFSNLSLINSEVNVKGIDNGVPDTRQMQGQAPYIINAGISYVDNKNNFSSTIMLNRVGHRLYIVGSNIIPNRWENPRSIIDLQFTKSFYKNKLEIRFNIRDLLHQDLIYYYKGTNRANNAFDSKVDYVNFERNFGSSYSFVISYKF
jgi:outer membrane receptor protein involved in Fe transport